MKYYKLELSNKEAYNQIKQSTNTNKKLIDEVFFPGFRFIKLGSNK